MSPRTDTERLDWMIATHASFGQITRVDADHDTGVVREQSAMFVRVGCELMYEWHCFDGATPRDAIDAGMEGPACEGEDGNCRLAGRFADRGGGRDPLTCGPSLRAQMQRQMAPALARALADAPHDVWTALCEGGAFDLDRFGDLSRIADRIVTAALDDAFAPTVEHRP